MEFKDYVESPVHMNLPLFEKLGSLVANNNREIVIVENEINIFNEYENIRNLLHANDKKITVIVHCRDQALPAAGFRDKIHQIYLDLVQYEKFKLVLISSVPYHWEIDFSRNNRLLYIYYPEYLGIYWNLYKDVTPLSADRKFSKHFLCLNKRAEFLRQLLYYTFYNKNWLEKSHFSYLCENYFLGELFHNKSFNDIHNMIIAYPQYRNLKQPNCKFLSINNDTLLADYANCTDFVQNVDPTWQAPYELFNDSFCSIVIETSPTHSIVNVSEKTFRPIAMQQPLLLFSSKNTNRLLNELGLNCNLSDTEFYKWDTGTDFDRFDNFVKFISQFEKKSISALHALNEAMERNLVTARSRYQELFFAMIKKQDKIFSDVEHFISS